MNLTLYRIDLNHSQRIKKASSGQSKAFKVLIEFGLERLIMGFPLTTWRRDKKQLTVLKNALISALGSIWLYKAPIKRQVVADKG